VGGRSKNQQAVSPQGRQRQADAAATLRTRRWRRGSRLRWRRLDRARWLVVMIADHETEATKLSGAGRARTPFRAGRERRGRRRGGAPATSRHPYLTADIRIRHVSNNSSATKTRSQQQTTQSVASVESHPVPSNRKCVRNLGFAKRDLESLQGGSKAILTSNRRSCYSLVRATPPAV